ncbi:MULTISPECIES: hypothetical protein [Arenibacter]|nr:MULTISPECIES: hypothetical protein [Arenibacter]
MRKSYFIMVLFATISMLYAQETSQVLNEGVVITLGPPSGSTSEYRLP